MGGGWGWATRTPAVEVGDGRRRCNRAGSTPPPCSGDVSRRAATFHELSRSCVGVTGSQGGRKTLGAGFLACPRAYSRSAGWLAVAAVWARSQTAGLTTAAAARRISRSEWANIGEISYTTIKGARLYHAWPVFHVVDYS